ncbi:MAG TPA: hypothetical protein VE863_04205 [Pyrinomonadaceae bacterium]|jgi:hypothetical protein|nr:hypothetical protein [Pyrinomonadaceae bacterium]
MKRIIVVVCIVIALSTAAIGQSRSRRTVKKTTPAKTTTSTAEAAAVRTEGATRVATQIKNLSTFLYLLGGVARGIEAIDAQAKGGQPSPTNEKNKAQLRSSFTDFRVAMDSLEVYFRSTPELQPYYTKLVGSASGAADAEAQATAGQFNQAGKTLLGVVGRLTDVLVGMR